MGEEKVNLPQEIRFSSNCTRRCYRVTCRSDLHRFWFFNKDKVGESILPLLEPMEAISGAYQSYVFFRNIFGQRDNPAPLKEEERETTHRQPVPPSIAILKQQLPMWSSDNQLLRHIAGPPITAPMTMSSQQQGSHSSQQRTEEKMKNSGQRNGVRQYKKSALPRRQCLKNRSLVAVVAPSSLENQCRRRRRLSSSRSLVVVILMERTRKTQTEEGEGPARLLRISPLRNANNLSTPLLRRRSSKQKSGSPPARKNVHGKPANLVKTTEEGEKKIRFFFF
nr:hypothetical protein Iba_chr10bCG5740 [Ipomoea batatas]